MVMIALVCEGTLNCSSDALLSAPSTTEAHSMLRACHRRGQGSHLLRRILEHGREGRLLWHAEPAPAGPGVLGVRKSVDAHFALDPRAVGAYTL